MRRATVLWAVLFAVFAAGAGLPAEPGRDLTEPGAQALLVTESVVSDRDLDLGDDYGARSWRDFYDGELVPRAGPRNGRLLDPIGIGFPLLIAPAYAAGGPVAVQLFLAALAAIGFVLAAALGRRLVPEPWPTAAALVAGLSPPAVVAATTISPDAVAGTVLAGAALLALRLREQPGLRWAFWCAMLIAALPWLGAKFGAPAIVVAAAAARWLRRRRRGLAGLVAIEIVVFSVVLYITVNDNLYGGPFPAALLSQPGATGASGVLEHLARAPRLLGLWIDRDVGLLRWAPFAALAFAAIWLLVRSRRERLALAWSDQVDVEVTAGFLVAICGAMVAFATFLAPTIAGPWFAGHELASVLPIGAALAAWPLRRLPRAGRALAAVTLLATVWVLVVARVDADAGLAPPRGPLPWLGAEDVLPRLR
ncbi:MAG TPA: hypothetical protein VHF51_05770 [Solirubrobacteraceae bacterium]|nr:hypothetical protein [Solirubrobacteraceae bacterium]